MKENINTEFGKRIAYLRNEQNISQEELAFRCGLHRAYIGFIERGEKSPTLNTVAKLAKGLNTSVKNLFYEISI
ncbi:MAG: helix-turn-helix transcriptional regulator [Alistipes sp.]|nr:helix-turn-helix transcriptional regulator [Alistipes sp.]